MEESEVIWEESDADEHRVVRVGTHGDGVRIEQVSSGPTTRLVYGETLYTQRLDIRGWDVAGARDALSGFLEHGGSLIDVEDALDALGIPYTYSGLGSKDVVFRPPVADGTPPLKRTADLSSSPSGYGRPCGTVPSRALHRPIA